MGKHEILYKMLCHSSGIVYYIEIFYPGPDGVKLFSCSTQLGMKFVLLINFKLQLTPDTSKSKRLSEILLDIRT